VQSVASTDNDHVVQREREMPSRRVEADLRRRIEADEWTSGQALPSIASLAAQYDVSRATVAKALRRMADDGLVEVVPQWGTFRT
jgi:DNA-binding GntR family transcriptional regulator